MSHVRGRGAAVGVVEGVAQIQDADEDNDDQLKPAVLHLRPVLREDGGGGGGGPINQLGIVLYVVCFIMLDGFPHIHTHSDSPLIVPRKHPLLPNIQTQTLPSLFPS